MPYYLNNKTAKKNFPDLPAVPGTFPQHGLPPRCRAASAAFRIPGTAADRTSRQHFLRGRKTSRALVGQVNQDTVKSCANHQDDIALASASSNAQSYCATSPSRLSDSCRDERAVAGPHDKVVNNVPPLQDAIRRQRQYSAKDAVHAFFQKRSTILKRELVQRDVASDSAASKRRHRRALARRSLVVLSGALGGWVPVPSDDHGRHDGKD
eukprot:CAMPEP_0198655108 /NCGR_PEP_ID=MMETSP1467-20131203/8151_1 /TAXON_ID=1462469 /ORGANISM="unid. sp., Strain CCMP2135" /LENGTH=209 /DNA_ID=CAMNT_0044391107 /DNA_START=52 /DNA_END=679 /DNA_ORIENTATION=-